MKISVVLPVFNGGDLLSKSVCSVLAQSFEDFEFLICDDCSTDDSYELLKKIKDPRVKLFRNELNLGLFPTLNKLISESSGALVHLWSQDDIMYRNCLEETFNFHVKYPQVGFSYCDRDIIDEFDRVATNNFEDLTPEFISQRLHDLIAFYTGSIAGNIANVTLTKKALDEVGLFDVSYLISADFEMLVRVSGKFPVGRIPVKLIQLRDHSGQLSRKVSSTIIAVKEDFRIFNTLINRSDSILRKKGMEFLKNGKNLYFTSIFLLALRKGHIKEAFSLLQIINRIEFFPLPFFRWIKHKFNRSKVIDNKIIIQEI